MYKNVFLVFIFFTVGCASMVKVVPTAVSVTDNRGQTVATQAGTQWVLLSGVDEHGLVAEAELQLLKEPDVNGIFETYVATGSPAAVLEIRHTGPQNLRRFYQVQTTEGRIGWISDYYVRSQAYVFDDHADTVPLVAEPDGEVIASLPNVSPVRLQGPPVDAWWPVQTLEGLTGWVATRLVKESPSPEFLLNEPHDHE